MKIRASGLHKLMTRSRTKGQLSETAKTAVLEQVLHDLYGFNKQIHTKYTQKGIELEDVAIEAVSLLKFVKMHKNTERRQDKHFTGECDLLTDNAIRDIKCSWDFSTHPFTQSMAADKVKKVAMTGKDKFICTYGIRASIGWILCYCPPQAICLGVMTTQLIIKIW